MTTIGIDDIQRNFIGHLCPMQSGEALVLVKAAKPVAEIKSIPETFTFHWTEGAHHAC